MNRQQLVDTLAMGKTRVVTSYIGPSSPEFNDVQSVVMTYEYDPRKAGQMVTDLGFSKGPDGMFRDGAGQPLQVEIRTTVGDELRANAMFAINAMWKEIGIGGEPVLIPRQQARDREYRVVRPAFELTHQPNELTERALQRFITAEVPAAPRWNGNNRARYSSPEYDALVDKYLVTLNPRDSLQVAKDLNRHFSEHLPAMGVLYRVDIMLIANKMQNLTADKNVLNAHEWDVKM
jgi:peptide/nickel transport system substrate-binding protein